MPKFMKFRYDLWSHSDTKLTTDL